MSVYMAIVIGIGVCFAKRANQNTGNYFLGGRTLGPWVSALSLEASDMSGWLLMGLPGVAYVLGLADKDSITIPNFLSEHIYNIRTTSFTSSSYRNCNGRNISSNYKLIRLIFTNSCFGYG